MSRYYLTDVDISRKDKFGNMVTECYEAWPSRNCKYCYGRGSETYRGKKTDLTNTKGETLYDHQDMPCRCIQLRKKESTSDKNPPTNLQ